MLDPLDGSPNTSMIRSGHGATRTLRLGCRATASWNRTRSRLAVATSPQVKEAVLRDLIRALDGLSREYLFDTLRREQAGEAVRTLVEANLGETHPLSEWTPE
ncbi:hypothetical protein [Clavibacter tessellarius]|uniref:hypothetical protein n=1 Tax=Clavibacter tessellarius TaxID=31965 RepID=UPI003252F2CF